MQKEEAFFPMSIPADNDCADRTANRSVQLNLGLFKKILWKPSR